MSMAWLAGAARRLVVGDALQHGDRVAIVVAPDSGAREQCDVGQTAKLSHDAGSPVVGRLRVDGLARPVGGAAEPRILLGKHHARAVLRRRFRRHQSRRTGAYHQHVAEGVHALVARRICRRTGLAETGGAADEMLAEHPEARTLQRPEHRTHEGLVVEACAEQLAAELVHRAYVEAERREAVLADDLQAVVDFQHCRLDVRLARLAAQHRHQRVGLVDAGAKHAARAMVLERSAEQRNAVGEQRRSKRVARMAGEILAVEAEADGARAVDQPAAGGTARAHAGVSALRRSCGLP